VRPCEEYLDLIGQKLDGCLSPEDALRLEAHLAQCPQCRAALEAYTWIDHGLENLTEEPPADLHSRILDAVAAEPKGETTPQLSDDTIRALPVKKRKFFFGPGTAMAAVAAVLVVLVGTGKIPLPGLVTTTSTSSSAAGDTAARSTETATMQQVTGTEFAAAMTGTVVEEAEEEAEEAAMDEEPAAAPAEAALSDEGVAVASDTSSLVFTESIDMAYPMQADDGAAVYLYHPTAGYSTTLLFPEDVDQSQVYYSISDENVAQVEDSRVRSVGEGTAVIVLWYDGWTETLVLDVGTEENADVAASFWYAGFDTQIGDDADLTTVADNFLQADYLAMQSAVWMTDWEVQMWHYENVTVQALGGGLVCFSADWRIQVARDSVWDTLPLAGDRYFVVSADADEETCYKYATVYYLLKQDENFDWQLCWQGSDLPDVTGCVRVGTGTVSQIVEVAEPVTAEEVQQFLTLDDAAWVEQDDEIICTLPADTNGLEAQLANYAAVITETNADQPWVTIFFPGDDPDAAEAAETEPAEAP
jgi:anti-sigma factor RsiW